MNGIYATGDRILYIFLLLVSPCTDEYFTTTLNVDMASLKRVMEYVSDIISSVYVVGLFCIAYILL